MKITLDLQKVSEQKHERPHRSQHKPFTQAEGALIYVKTGHLS